MLRTTTLGIALIACLVTPTVQAQQVGGAPRNVGGGVGGSAAAARGGVSGLSQTGQLDSDAMVQSSRQAFVGGGAQGNPRSLAGAGGMTGMGGMGGMTGMRGMGGMGGMLGGMGGMMGGMGGMMGRMGGMMGRGMGAGGMGGVGGRGMMGQAGMMGGMQGRGGMQQARMIRTPLRIGSGVINAPMEPRVGEFQARLERIPAIKGGEQIELSMDGSVVVLQGIVATPRDRELAARLLMLEPGVRDVRNELVVQPDLQP